MNFLVVDDIYTNRLLISEILKGFGHKILEADNGKLALEIIDKEVIDVVLMDIEMPVMNGIETTQHIRKNLPYPKNKLIVVALTAHNPDLFFDDYNDVGFDELLTKPYSVEKLKNMVETYQKKA